MDPDTFVLQNIDELFWMPAPWLTVGWSTLLGEERMPTFSSGFMVIEPDEDTFDSLSAYIPWRIKQAEKEYWKYLQKQY